MQFANSGETISDVVYVSMIFSILTLCIVFMSQISRICAILRPRKAKFSHITTVQGSFGIKCKDLTKRHAFAKDNISKSIDGVLATCKDKGLWTNRSDIQYETNVYYIKDLTQTVGAIECFFQSEILQIQVGNHNNAILKFGANIKQMSIRRSPNNKQLIDALTRVLKLEGKVLTIDGLKDVRSNTRAIGHVSIDSNDVNIQTYNTERAAKIDSDLLQLSYVVDTQLQNADAVGSNSGADSDSGGLVFGMTDGTSNQVDKMALPDQPIAITGKEHEQEGFGTTGISGTTGGDGGDGGDATVHDIVTPKGEIKHKYEDDEEQDGMITAGIGIGIGIEGGGQEAAGDDHVDAIELALQNSQAGVGETFHRQSDVQ